MICAVSAFFNIVSSQFQKLILNFDHIRGQKCWNWSHGNFPRFNTRPRPADLCRLVCASVSCGGECKCQARTENVSMFLCAPTALSFPAAFPRSHRALGTARSLGSLGSRIWRGNKAATRYEISKPPSLDKIWGITQVASGEQRVASLRSPASWESSA